MAKQITAIPFKGTPEQEAELREFMAGWAGKEGSTMPVLQKAQEIYGYLPIEVQKMVADGLGGAAAIRHQKIAPELFSEDKLLDTLFSGVYKLSAIEKRALAE